MLFRLDFAIIKAVITVKPYLVYSHIWLNCFLNDCHFGYKQKFLKKHIVPLFLGKFTTNFDVTNMISIYTKDFFIEKMTQICQN